MGPESSARITSALNHWAIFNCLSLLKQCLKDMDWPEIPYIARNHCGCLVLLPSPPHARIWVIVAMASSCLVLIGASKCIQRSSCCELPLLSKVLPSLCSCLTVSCPQVLWEKASPEAGFLVARKDLQGCLQHVLSPLQRTCRLLRGEEATRHSRTVHTNSFA